jgi:hypothetical protein
MVMRYIPIINGAFSGKCIGYNVITWTTPDARMEGSSP